MATTSADPAPGGRRAVRKERTRQRLLGSAVRLFATQGYDATSIDAIAQDAEVARQTFFNYFPAKEDVVTAWVEQRRAAVLDGLRSAADEDALVRLARGLDAVAALYESDAALSRPMVRTWVRCEGPVRPGADATADLLGDVISHGQSAGQVREDIPARDAAHLVLDVYLGALYRWAATPGSTLPTTLRTPLNIVLDSLRHP